MYSIVTPNRNRVQILAEVVPSWQRAPLVQDIVVVDFGSDVPITHAHFSDPAKIKIVRVANPDDWRIGLAINIGVDHAACDDICKLDSDIEIQDAARLAAMPPRSTFFRGHYQSPVSNGQVIFAKRDWAAIGGYNEWLSGYGFDDSDFYMRLARSGIAQNHIAPGFIAERPYMPPVGADQRLRTAFFELQVDDKTRKIFTTSRNTYLAYLSRWSAKDRLRYTSEPAGGNAAVVELEPFPRDYTRMNAFANLLGALRLSGPPDMVESLNAMVATFIAEDGGL